MKTTAILPSFLCILLAGCSRNSPSTSAITANPVKESSPFLLPVKVSGKWGYVNSSGQLVVNPQFDEAEEFHEGRAAICLGNCKSWESNDAHWGYIDASGKVVVAPQYGSAYAFNEGLASVCTGDCSISTTPKPSSRGYIDRD